MFMKKLLNLLAVVAVLCLSACNGATFVSPSEQSVNFTIDGGEKGVMVSSDGSWSVGSSPDWVKTDVKDSILLIKTERNETGSPRQGDIVLKGKNVEATIHVAQASKCTHITVSSSKVEFDKDGGTETLTVDTDGLPQVEASDGFTASYDNGKLTVTAAANDGGAKRGEIKLTCEDQSTTIYASQKGNVCKKCGGTGKITCPTCRGKGLYDIDAGGGSAYCERCGGFDPPTSELWESGRKGTGRIKCPDCGGTGVGN